MDSSSGSQDLKLSQVATHVVNAYNQKSSMDALPAPQNKLAAPNKENAPVDVQPGLN